MMPEALSERRDFSQMQRVFVPLTDKSVEETETHWVIKGVATTPRIDRVGDTVNPLGAKYERMPKLLLYHDSRQPIGNISSAKATAKGIPFEARIPKVTEPGKVKDRIDEAVHSVKYDLLSYTSIGFKPIEFEPLDAKDPWGPQDFKTWDWMELSLVTIPANPDAVITGIKSIDDEIRTARLKSLDQSQLRAASGEVTQRAAGYRLTPSPGASGHSATKGTGMKTIKEQLQDLENKRAANVARMQAIDEEGTKEGRGMTEAEGQEFDTLDSELKSIDTDIGRKKKLAAELVEKSAPVKEEQDDKSQAKERAPHVTWSKSQLPKGIPFTRYAMCIGKSRGNLMQAEVLSRQFMDSTPEVNMALKAAVAAGTTQDTTWAAPLVQLQDMQSEFIEFLRPLTLLGQLEGRLRRVPFNIKFTRQTAGTTGTFVGEGLPKPLGKMDFELLSLTWAKAATIIVMTEELVRFSNPSAEMLARDDLAAGIARYLDLRFIDPVYAGVANVSPASITNGITPIASTGTTVALITADIATALKAMAAANLNLGGLVWIMNPSVAIDLSLKRTAQDLFAFPDITATGGTFLGYPVIMSNNVALSGSPTEAFVVLLDPSNIMLADDGGVTIDMSTEASLQMDGAPTNPATSTVNLWQSNMIALRAERFINWRRRRDTAVQLITMNAVW